MLHAQLTPHPAEPAPSARALSVTVERSSGTLSWHYQLSGDIERLAIPPPETPMQRDGLWQHTCFEAFIRGTPLADYIELNFSPSGTWAAYAFDDYRTGMRTLSLAQPPAIQCVRRTNRLNVRASIKLPDLDGPLQLGLAAVIEAQAGARSYWALTHPGPRPDFHHPSSFVLKVS